MKLRNEADVAVWWAAQPREELRMLIEWFSAKSPSDQRRLLDDPEFATRSISATPAAHAELSPRLFNPSGEVPLSPMCHTCGGKRTD